MKSVARRSPSSPVRSRAARASARPARRVSAKSAPHYAWGAGCDGWRLLDGTNLSVIEERMQPGAREWWHVHRRSHQFFYVRSGCLLIQHGSSSARLRPWDGLHVPPGIRHQVSNMGQEDAYFLVISSPSTAGDRTEVGKATATPRGALPPASPGMKGVMRRV